MTEGNAGEGGEGQGAEEVGLVGVEIVIELEIDRAYKEYVAALLAAQAAVEYRLDLTQAAYKAWKSQRMVGPLQDYAVNSIAIHADAVAAAAARVHSLYEVYKLIKKLRD